MHSSHEGTKMGEAVSHLHKMHKEHGHTDHHRAHGMGGRMPDDKAKPAADHMKVQGKAKEPMKAIKAMGRAGRRDA